MTVVSVLTPVSSLVVQVLVVMGGSCTGGPVQRATKSSQTTTGAIAREEQSLSTAISELPPFMRRANSTFVNLRATLTDLVVYDNTAMYGGGVAVRGASASRAYVTNASGRVETVRRRTMLPDGVPVPGPLHPRRSLSAYADGRLPAWRRAVVERHLVGCTRCALDVARTRALRGFLTGSIDLVLRVPGVEAGEPDRFVVADYKTNWLAPPGEELTAWHHRPAALRRVLSDRRRGWARPSPSPCRAQPRQRTTGRA